MVIFVDNASRLQRPYGAREKSAAAICSVVKHFKADMGVPRAFRTDNGTEYLNSMLVDFCNDLGICREFTAPYTPQHNRPVESAISQAFKAVHAARLGVPQLYPDICLREVRGCFDAAGTSLWLESLLWALDRYNRAATSVNEAWLSPYESFYGSRPRLLLLLFLQLAYRRVPRQRKTDPQAGMCCFIKFGYNHGRGCYRLLDAETGRVAYSGDVIWHHPSSGTTRHLAPPGNTGDHTDPGCAIRTTKRYLRPHVAVCAGCRIISCTRHHSASSRTGKATTDTAYTNVELHSSDPPTR